MEAGSEPNTPGEGSNIESSIEQTEAHIAWFEEIAQEPGRLAAMEEGLRTRLRRAAGSIVYPERAERKAFVRQRRKDDKRKVRDHNTQALEGTSNRALKRALRFAQAPPDLDIDEKHRRLLAEQAGPAPQTKQGAPQVLESPNNCYICKEDYTRLHHHYDSMCPTCAEFNWLKRNQSADLTGRVALVTGSRVKIGYEICLMLLRAGASVIATTRFPTDAAERIAKEADFPTFADRIVFHGLDLRHTPSVEAFAAHIVQTESRLDFLIHNACQTVRRPPEFYNHLVDKEHEGYLDPQAETLLRKHRALNQILLGKAAETNAANSAALPTGKDEELVHGSERDRSEPNPSELPASQTSSLLPGLSQSSQLSQLDLLGEGEQWRLFPKGMVDPEGQQLDLRAANSWRMELHQVPTVELLEVQLVNSIAPFVLNARLKPLMLAVETPDKHVVNVSAMEGQFNRNLKTTRHPHTNMAKAALNMMTRTSAADYIRDGIHMNSVDTGWVTDEDPFEEAVKKQSEFGFTPPLDSVDGAARVMDPIFTGFLTGVHCWGQFLKDYKPAPW